MPLIKFISRTVDLPPQGGLGPVDVASLLVVSIAVLALVAWFVLIMVRKRAARNREENVGAAFLSVRGVVKAADGQSRPTYTIPNTSAQPPIVMPEKAVTKPSGQEWRGTLGEKFEFPRPLSSTPFAIAMSVAANLPAKEGEENRPDSYLRDSVLSTGAGQTRFSFASGISIVSQATTTTGIKRRVRQLFNPVLPDELLVSTPGEQLTVMQSFDDGWCLVVREVSIYVSTTKSLFKRNSRLSEHENVELGVIPAWCFIKPVKGLRVERPLRSSSLGIAVQFQSSGFSSRDEVISWSNL